MAKPLFVLADTNAEYLAPLEAKLVETFRDSIELEVFDDIACAEEFVAKARRIDVLIVAERLYNSFLRQNDIGMVYKLTEEMSEENLQGSAVRVLYKYNHIQKIFGEIEYGARQYVQTSQVKAQKTKVVVVYSALGGIGKTTVALGLSANLASNHKRVLFVDAENIQDFAYYLQDASTLPSSASGVLSSSVGDIYGGLKPHLRREGFDYLPPLRMAASAMGIDCSAYNRVVKEFQRRVDYDYIVVDTDSVFDTNKDELMQLADKVILVTGLGDFARYKTELLMKNFASVDSGRFLTVCNSGAGRPPESRGYDSQGQNADVFIEPIQGKVALQSLQMNRDLEKISYLI